MSIRNSGVNQKGEPVISFVRWLSSSGAKGLHERRIEAASGRGADAAASKADERRAIGVACGAHALHDGSPI